MPVKKPKIEYEYTTVQMTYFDRFKRNVPEWTEETVNRMASVGWELIQQSSVGSVFSFGYPLLTFRRAK